MSRIGVFTCHCGRNIAGTVNIPEVCEAAKAIPGVVFTDDNMYSCSVSGQASIQKAIKEQNLDRVVIGACSPRMHENTFRKLVASTGLNPYLLEIANLREHCSWVHSSDPEAATAKAIDLLKMAVAKTRLDEPLFAKEVGVTKRALVIGGGITGIQAALDIANAGHEVILVEREPSIGGRMSQLDKTFPTLDCSACILTPKMVEVSQHPNITLLSYAEVSKVSGFVGNFKVEIRKKARYVDMDKCTGCNDCTVPCPVAVSSEFDLGMSKRKAIYRPFPQAVPNVFTIDRRGYPPCRVACPAGVNAHGYISLISQGKFKEAVEVVRRTMPFVGICGRVCTHPCETECERGDVDEPIAICSLKRFIADYELKEGREKAPLIEKTKSTKVAIIGSGPAGLACAYDLVRQGYPVTVFEAAPQSGGLLRYGIPEYRLPNEVLDNEISYIEELGVEIKTSTPVKNLEDVFNQGYEAVFLGTGAGISVKMSIPNKDTKGVIQALDFLKQATSGKKVNLGERVAVIGGGNAAVDAARAAKRLGAKKVSIIYRRSRVEMPAVVAEVNEAEQEGVEIHFLVAPVSVLSKGDKLTGIQCIRMELGEPDASGRRRPIPVKGSEFDIDVDNVIMAIGQTVDKSQLPKELEYTRWGTITVDPVTLQTNIDGVFAGGDVVAGPADVIAAIASGKEAAISIDCYLRGADLTEGRPETIKKVEEVAKEGVEIEARATMPVLGLEKRKAFTEVELGFDEKMAIEEAKRCLNCSICSECRQCVAACEAKAIDFEQDDELVEVEVGSIVAATGFTTFDHTLYGEYGGGKYPDVITGLQLERLLSASGPTEGEVLRPSDGTHPKTVVFISCVGSRDDKMGKLYCSKICCMYMAKQAIMLREHDPEVQSYVFYIDNRTGGKNFEEFGRRAQEEAEVIYLRGRVSKIYQDGKKLIVWGEDSLIGRPVEIPADLVVLATGVVPNEGVVELAQQLNISYDSNNFLTEAHPKLRPVETQTDGIFVAGACVGPRDVPDCVAQGSAAASKVLALLSQDVLLTDPSTAVVDSMKCVGCFMCQAVCPFNAIEPELTRDQRTIASVNESLCKGCGLCVAACRPGAMNLRGFTTQQIMAEVVSLWR
jgi:heterodisulfide reductase subunit A